MYEKIEILDRINTQTLHKYIIFRHVQTEKYFLFYEYKLIFPSADQDPRVHHAQELVNDSDDPENPEYVKKVHDFFEKHTVYEPEYELRLSTYEAEIKSIIYKEQAYFLDLILQKTPKSQHQSIFEDQFPDGFDSINELLDVYLQKYYNKTLKQRFEEQDQNRRDIKDPYQEWIH